MSEPLVFLDHIEIHVDDVDTYGAFLIRLFRGGRFKRISDSGTSMFVTLQGDNFEIKKREGESQPIKSGMCLPCIRVSDARSHIQALGLDIDSEVANPEGAVFFFTDHEGLQWHAKAYAHCDRYINW